MSVAPIGLGKVFPPEYIDLMEFAKTIPVEKGYGYPSELIRVTILKLDRNNFTSDPAFGSIASFVKQGPPSAMVLDLMMRRSKGDDYPVFADWIRRMSQLYYPVREVLEMHLQRITVTHPRLDQKIDDLAGYITDSLVKPFPLGSTVPPRMTPDDEMTIALAAAQLCVAPGVLMTSPLLIPEFLSCSWRVVMSEETADYLLNHKHAPKVIHRILSQQSFKDLEEMKSFLDFDVPAFASGQL